MPYDTIRINFQYGYTGNSSLNTLATTKHNRTCKTMVNFIPMSDGSVVKRAPVEEMPLSQTHKDKIAANLKQLHNNPDRDKQFGFFVHSPGGGLQVPVFILGDPARLDTIYFAALPGVVEPSYHQCLWIPPSAIGVSSIESLSVATIIVDVDVPPTFGQLITFAGPEPYSFYMQTIILRNGPCGSQERKDGAMYSWKNERPGSEYNSYSTSVHPGDIIKLRFHPDSGVNREVLEGFVGSTFAFNVPVSTVDPFQKSSGDQVQYRHRESVIYHGKNLYMLWDKDYKPGADAPPPTHDVPGEVLYYSDGNYTTGPTSIGGWLFLNKGVGYAYLRGIMADNVGIMGQFEVQTALAQLHWAIDEEWFDAGNWPFVSESSWNLPVYGKGPGYFEACCVAFDRLWFGGGRDSFTASTALSLSTDLDRNNSVFGSETSDWENFDELIEGPTRARAISVSSRGGSPVLGLKALDPQTLGIFYRDGLSILQLDAEGNITVKEAANLRPADKPYGCKFGPYTCCVGASKKNVVGAIYRYENNTQVTVDLLGPIYETIGQTTIKRMFSVGGTPEKLLLLRDDGVVTVLFLINGNEVGFYDIVTEHFIFDISPSVNYVYFFQYKLTPPDNYQVFLSRLDLENTDFSGRYAEFGKDFEAYIEVNSIIAPTDVAQETWVSADRIRSVKMNKSSNAAKINGYDATKDKITSRNLIQADAMNRKAALRISSDSGEPLIIHWLEVAYERASIMVG